MTEIPWQSPEAFQEAWFYLDTMDRRRPAVFEPVRGTAGRIRQLLSGLDREMERMCGLTCPGCRDNCCARATIWYDFRDLLFLKFAGLPLPALQIEKKVQAGATVCMHLTPEGCALPRVERPFVCTWYICGAQQGIQGCGSVRGDVERVKGLRAAMEEDFCGACL